MQARKTILIVGAAAALAAALVAAGCGSSSAQSPASASPAGAVGSPVATSAATASPQATGQAAGALTGEAASASAGDVPDNQVFLTLHNKAHGFVMKYPEGWAQKSRGDTLTIQDKNNIVRVAITTAPAPTVASVQKEMAALKQKTPSLKAAAPATMTVSGHPAIKVTYTTTSAPNPVTGKTVTLMVDRYYFWQGGRVAVIDLGTPQGVDNVDAYRLMSESFAWR
jgi:hypothetical protein